jgi:hypothetical protein
MVPTMADARPYRRGSTEPMNGVMKDASMATVRVARRRALSGSAVIGTPRPGAPPAA